MRLVTSLQDVNAILADIYNQLDALQSKDINLHKRRIRNAAASESDYDYVIRKELYDLFLKIENHYAEIKEQLIKVDIRLNKIETRLHDLDGL